MNKIWVEPEIRDSVVKHLSYLSERTGTSLTKMLKVITVSSVKYHRWVSRAGIANKHNGKIPRAHWLTPEEVNTIENYAREHYSNNDFYLRDGYRRIAYKMLDENIAAVSASSVYRILSKAGLLNQWNTNKSKLKGTGFKQPDYVHKHWHTDIKYVSFNGTFLFLISVLDGYSRYLLHHQIRHTMSAYDVHLVIQQTRDKYPGVRAKVISDNGSQYISREFKEFIKDAELEHIKTSVRYPQSNGKIERWHRSINQECLRIKNPVSFEDYQKYIDDYINYYNKERLHGSLNYLTPEDYFLGRVEQRINDREVKLQNAELKREDYWRSQSVAA